MFKREKGRVVYVCIYPCYALYMCPLKYDDKVWYKHGGNYYNWIMFLSFLCFSILCCYYCSTSYRLFLLIKYNSHKRKSSLLEQRWLSNQFTIKLLKNIKVFIIIVALIVFDYSLLVKDALVSLRL